MKLESQMRMVINDLESAKKADKEGKKRLADLYIISARQWIDILSVHRGIDLSGCYERNVDMVRAA